MGIELPFFKIKRSGVWLPNNVKCTLLNCISKNGEDVNFMCILLQLKKKWTKYN